jgi:hypothetical protein
VEFWICHSLARIFPGKGEEANAKTIALAGRNRGSQKP